MVIERQANVNNVDKCTAKDICMYTQDLKACAFQKMLAHVAKSSGGYLLAHAG